MRKPANYNSRLLARLAVLKIEIPEWVPERLRVEFADCAIHHGEERAASYVRKLKREYELAELNRLVSRS